MDEILSPNEEYADWKEPKTGYDHGEAEPQATNLSDLPVIDSSTVNEVISEGTSESRFVKIETDKVVGRPFAGQNKGGWGFEYSGREGRIEQISQTLRNPDPSAQERVFHFNDPAQRIKLDSLKGPAGPIYFVADGTHRVAASKSIGLETIPCEVKDQVYPQIQILRDAESVRLMKRKIEQGLVDADIQTVTTTTGEDAYRVTIRSEVVPWARVSSQKNFIDLSRIYEKTYPHSLDDLPVPRDALVDPIANNFFMSGRWEEWEEQFKDKPRDDRGIVVY